METKLSSAQQEMLRKNPIVALCTASTEADPRSIFVEVNKVEEDKLIITDNEMHISRENILHNSKVFILVADKNYASFLQINGIAEYYTEGEYFEYVKDLPANMGHTPKGVIIVTYKTIKEGK